MQLSVIIPVRNEERVIGRTIRHIQRNSRGKLAEILVVDGGSADDTVGQAKAAGARVVVSPEAGRGAQLHYGAGQSVGDVLYFVHADTLPPATFPEDIEAALHAGWDLGNFQYDFDSDRFLLRINAFFTRFRWFFTQGGDRTFFIRRSTYFEIGGYDPGHVVMEDYEFLRRARRTGHPFVMLSAKCLVSARKYEKNSWLRVQIANLIVYNLWAWGYEKPRKLRKLYWRMLKMYNP